MANHKIYEGLYALSTFILNSMFTFYNQVTKTLFMLSESNYMYENVNLDNVQKLGWTLHENNQLLLDSRTTLFK